MPKDQPGTDEGQRICIQNCGNPQCPTRDDPRQGIQLKNCGACKGVKYCGQECQRAHWGEHRPVCSHLRRRRAQGLKSNSKVFVNNGVRDIPDNVLRASYRLIQDEDNTTQAIHWDIHLQRIEVVDKSVLGEGKWKRLTKQVSHRFPNMGPCKRVIMTTSQNNEKGAVYILCVCPSFKCKCPAPLDKRQGGGK